VDSYVHPAVHFLWASWYTKTMARSRRPVMMVMKDKDIRLRRQLISNWDFMCIICGRPFANLACVTKEHIIPKSVAPRGMTDNLAPSHYRCNELRKTSSILTTARKIDTKASMMSQHHFEEWLNAPVPNRVVPPLALHPLSTPACLRPPETLPGL